jgi:adenosylhomocysteine nucleosidase
MIAVTFALSAESSEFMRCLQDKSRNDRNGVRITRGKIDDRSIEVLHTGVGEKICRQRLAKFLQDQRFDYLISAGFAGGLNNQLEVGDLMFAKNFSTVNPSEIRALLSGLPVHTANLLTVPALIDSREKRNKLAVASGTVAADMETEFIARACAARAIPLLSLRVISDTPHNLFPAPANVLFDIERQQTQMLKLATHLLAHPTRVPHLFQFAQRIRRARMILANALVTVLRSL